MKNIFIIPVFFLLSAISLKGQSPEFGICYVPIGFSKITFDQDFIVFDDYTSSKLNQNYVMSFPSLSNSGLFVRFPFKSFAVQTGLNFQRNTYFYSENTRFEGTKNLFSYSSFDIPLQLNYTINPDNILKFRILAGANAKFFKIRTNYYSIFGKMANISYYNVENKAAIKNRDFMMERINPFSIYSRFGVGLRYFGMTIDLCFDKSITPLNKNIDKYNANFEDTYQINIMLGFQFAKKDLKYKRNVNKIIKE